MPDPLEQHLRSTIRDVRDFPKPGILFRDITPLLADPRLFAESVEALWKPYADAGVDAVAGIESRGFIFATALAVLHALPLIPLRKPGKLPAETFRESYDLEYGRDALEMHRDALAPGRRVLIVDDLLATGGTAAAAARLIGHGGGTVVGIAMLIELTDLGGRRLVEPHPLHTVLRY